MKSFITSRPDLALYPFKVKKQPFSFDDLKIWFCLQQKSCKREENQLLQEC